MSASKEFNPVAFAKGQLKLKRYPPSEITKLTYERFLQEYQKSKRASYPYVFIAEKGLERIRAIEFLLRHPDGENAGKPFILHDWQKFAITQMYGWLTKDSVKKPCPIPRFRETYIEIAKKNGKTTFIAILIICHMILDRGFSLPKAYCFATTLQQADVCVKIR